MATAQHSLVASYAGTAGWGARAAGIVAGLLREWRLQRDLRDLEELDARALRDMGIAPGGLESAVRHGRRARPASGSVPAVRLMPASFTEWR